MTESPAPPGSARRTIVIRLAVTVAVIGILFGAVQLTANLLYDDARRAFDSLATDAETSRSSLVEAVDELHEVSKAGESVTATASVWLMDAEAKQNLATAVDDAAPVVEQMTSTAGETAPTAATKPGWAWELFGATAQLNADSSTTVRLIDDYRSAGQDAAAATSVLQEAGTAAVTSATESAEQFEADHISARNPDIVAFRAATQRLTRSSDDFSAEASTAYLDMEQAAAAMLTSEHAELMEKSGPLNSARDEVETFARSLAPGLLLDFDWAPLVNGFGDADSMGGYASWWYGDPGYANIELSNSVAERWPSERSRALVAHEVGHAISVRCEGAYDDSSQDKVEDWATAWAISMGYLNRANGTSTYGTPPQELIDAAAACR
ncbi:hypothetical protein ACSS7Z_13545 [Microbacterium sp. A82]|uniref:hypothetical protein n=1 Tax=Microbacterium sp. A82 TaxID=3450452 RepID=UPI003F2D7F96